MRLFDFLKKKKSGPKLAFGEIEAVLDVPVVCPHCGVRLRVKYLVSHGKHSSNDIVIAKTPVNCLKCGKQFSLDDKGNVI